MMSISNHAKLCTIIRTSMITLCCVVASYGQQPVSFIPFSANITTVQTDLRTGASSIETQAFLRRADGSTRIGDENMVTISDMQLNRLIILFPKQHKAQVVTLPKASPSIGVDSSSQKVMSPVAFENAIGQQKMADFDTHGVQSIYVSHKSATDQTTEERWVSDWLGIAILTVKRNVNSKTTVTYSAINTTPLIDDSVFNVPVDYVVTQ